MKKLLFLFLLVYSSFVWSQTTYTSPFTQSFPSGLIEDINRKITITDEEITIVSETMEGKDIQILRVQNRIINRKGLHEFYCTSKDGLAKTLVILNVKEPPYLEVFQPDLNDANEIRHCRILLD